MRSLFCLPAIAWLLLLVIAAVPPRASAQDIFVTPVANAPFSGVVHVERTRILHDGAIVNSKSIRNIARDGRGRIHNESRMLVPASDTKTPRLIRIHLYDPQTRISAFLDPQERTFWTKTVNHPPSAVPPTIRYASPPGDALPQNEFTKQEDLGIHEMEGLPVHGVRETQTVPAENGTGKEIDITDEYWYSDDLRINLMIKHSDPREGTTTMTVSDITRVEPDPSLFEIPNGYEPARAGQEADQ